MMADISVKLLESNSVIRKKIHDSLAKSFNKTLSKNANNILNQLRPVISSALATSPELQSLSGGTLRIDFGLTSDPSSAIVSSIVSTLDIKVTKATSSSASITGGLLITMQPINYSNLLSLSVAEQIIEDGSSLPWLRWLLTLGQQIIIADYGVQYESGRGRSGGGSMRIEARPFKVNSAYAGTVDDNFITRSINKVSPQIRNIIIKGMQ